MDIEEYILKLAVARGFKSPMIVEDSEGVPLVMDAEGNVILAITLEEL